MRQHAEQEHSINAVDSLREQRDGCSFKLGIGFVSFGDEWSEVVTSGAPGPVSRSRRS
jgi:hypothetical protein